MESACQLTVRNQVCGNISRTMQVCMIAAFRVVFATSTTVTHFDI